MKIEEIEKDNEFLKVNKIVKGKCGSKRKHLRTSKYLEDEYDVN